MGNQDSYHDLAVMRWHAPHPSLLEWCQTDQAKTEGLNKIHHLIIPKTSRFGEKKKITHHSKSQVDPKLDEKR